MKPHSFRKFSTLAVMSFVAMGSVVVACGDDDSTPGTTQPDASTADTGSEASQTSGQIDGTATYNGAKKGPLIVAVLRDPPVPGQPPAQPPAGVGSNESPTWPGTNNFSVKNVPPGTYYVGAYIMVGPEHRMGAQAGDPIAVPAQQVTVTAGQTATVTLNLVDLGPPDGGAEGGADGGDGGDDGGDAGDGGDGG